MSPRQRRPRAPATGSEGPAVRAFLHRHRRAARIVMALVLPVLLLGTLELALRVAGFGYPTRLYLPVPDTDLYGANRKFGWRFFPRAIARKPLAQAFGREKPAGTCRVFVMGASAAAGIPDAVFSFGQMLDVMLSARHPGVRFEVINTAITATNSHVVLPIAAECADYEPDLFLVYLGNNEVIGPYGIGASREAAAADLGVIRAGVALRTTRIGQLLQAVGAKLRREDDVVQEWGGMGQYSRNQVASDDPELDRVHENFRRNLEDICRAGTAAGAQVVLSTVAVNLRDSAPFASLADTTRAPAVHAAWLRALRDGSELAAVGRHAAARDSFLVAARLAPHHAETRYLLGRSLLATGDTAGAGPHFAAALEHDALRFRTDRRLNEIIRATAAAGAADGVGLADSEAFIRAHEPTGSGLPGRELFYEHVHLTFGGNHLLARALLPTVEAALPDWVRERKRAGADVPDPEACARALAFTPWNEYNNWSQIRTMVVRYPFTAQADHEADLARLDRRLTELRAGASSAQARELLAIHDAAWARRPDDLLLGLNFAKLLAQTGNAAAASRIFDRVLATQPPMPDQAAEDLARYTGGG